MVCTWYMYIYIYGIYMVYTWYYMVYAWYIRYMVLLHYISLSIHVNWKACSTSGSSSRHALGDARNQPHPLNGHQPASATLGWKDSELVDVALGALRALRWKSLKAMASARQEMQWDAMRSIHPHEYWWFFLRSKKRQTLQSKSKESSSNVIWFSQTPECRNELKALVLYVFVSLSKSLLQSNPLCEAQHWNHSSCLKQRCWRKTSTVWLVRTSWTEPKQYNKRPTEKNTTYHSPWEPEIKHQGRWRTPWQQKRDTRNRWETLRSYSYCVFCQNMQKSQKLPTTQNCMSLALAQVAGLAQTGTEHPEIMAPFRDTVRLRCIRVDWQGWIV